MIRHNQVKLYHLKSQTLKHVEVIDVSNKLHNIHQWKGFELEITDFNYHDDPTHSVETIPSQTSNSTTYRSFKSFR